MLVTFSNVTPCFSMKSNTAVSIIEANLGLVPVGSPKSVRMIVPGNQLTRRVSVDLEQALDLPMNSQYRDPFTIFDPADILYAQNTTGSGQVPPNVASG
jgi:hypothetical protein